MERSYRIGPLFGCNHDEITKLVATRINDLISAECNSLDKDEWIRILESIPEMTGVNIDFNSFYELIKQNAGSRTELNKACSWYLENQWAIPYKR